VTSVQKKGFFGVRKSSRLASNGGGVVKRTGASGREGKESGDRGHQTKNKRTPKSMYNQKKKKKKKEKKNTRNRKNKKSLKNNHKEPFQKKRWGKSGGVRKKEHGAKGPSESMGEEKHVAPGGTRLEFPSNHQFCKGKNSLI